VRGERHGWRQVFDLRRRGLTLALVLVFWTTLLIGVIADWVTPVG
jgi:NhaP-type Na+/H+ or K+/H+ antiporter